MSLFNENFYTDDFDQEMLDYVRDLGSISRRTGIDTDIQTKYKYLKYGTACDYFWTNDTSRICGSFNYLTKQQFKEKVGMTQKQFTKADLKDGMVVKHRGGCHYSDKYSGLNLVVKDSLLQADEFSLICHYNQDLTSEEFTEFDIVEVFEVLQNQANLKNITNWKLKSIWKREDKSQNQLEIASIQAEMDKLNERLNELKGKV